MCVGIRTIHFVYEVRPKFYTKMMFFPKYEVRKSVAAKFEKLYILLSDGFHTLYMLSYKTFVGIY